MAEQKGAKAPEKTAEGLRRVGVIPYDVDPDQLACVACGQQWHWWHCPERLQPVDGRPECNTAS